VTRPQPKYDLLPSTTARELHAVYDYAVIGAGIGGLVCANYLARAGARVVLLEQHYLVGGCCTTYIKGSHYINPAVQYLNGFEEGGTLRGLCAELGVGVVNDLYRFEENDVVVSGGEAYCFSPSKWRTMARLCDHFPASAARVREFFEYFESRQYWLDSARTRFASFREVLAHFLDDPRLVRIFEVLICAYTTLESDQVHPLTARAVLNAVVFSPRFTPDNGRVQSVSDALGRKYLKRGGHLLLRHAVDAIEPRAGGFMLDTSGGARLGARKLICNVAPAEFRKMYRGPLPEAFAQRVESTGRSNSIISSHYKLSGPLALRGVREIDPAVAQACTLFIDVAGGDYSDYEHFPARNVLSVHNLLNDSTGAGDVLSVFSIVNTPPLSYWSAHKARYVDLQHRLLAEHVVGAEGLELLDAASPHSIHRFTRNDLGAVYGAHASIDPAQYRRYIMSENPELSDVFFAGHWVVPGGGGTERVAHAAQRLMRRLLPAAPEGRPAARESAPRPRNCDLAVS
jgi:phytoene dehydrogenase-like protein